MLSPRRPSYDPVQLESPPDDKNPSAPGHDRDFDDYERAASLSYSSHAPINSGTQPWTTYPPSGAYNQAGKGVTFPLPDSEQDSGRAGQRPHASPYTHNQPGSGRGSSWDILSGVRKFEESYDQFDSRHATQDHLVFADGDLPKTKISRIYNYLLNVSIVTRWMLFIVPVLAIIWIPGIIGLTSGRHAEIWGVRLVWWSVWLSVAWGGWWGCLAASMMLPRIIRATVGIVAVGTRRYIEWLEALHRYFALTGWTLIIWIAWNPLIDTRQDKNASENSVKIVDLIGKLLFGFLLCAAVLLFEKISIQWIAGKFHERSYSERIADQKFAVKTLTTLYRHSSEMPGRSDTLHDTRAAKRATRSPRQFVKQALRGVRFAATTTTTALGNVASEITGSSVLQPNSPQAMVQTALESANKTRLLARRLFYSFRKPGKEHLTVDDISRFFPAGDDAEVAFAILDKDGNGDLTLEETEQACLDFHREQLSIEHSMQDLDSAVGRLDNILMSVYVIVAVLIMAVTLEAQLASLITGAGTLILGLSWLIGGSLSDVLNSIIFLFIRHPFDVGDRIDLGKDNGGTYTVKEIRLLSSIFLDGQGTLVQAPNTVLNGLMSEPFTFDVSYGTTFEQIEHLRSLMLAFVGRESRDYQPLFDVAVVDIPDQEKMTLKADIMYKSNWQQGAIKAKRRNKWLCALKMYLAEAKVYGPGGNPDAAPAPKRYTLVPWEQVKAEEPNPALPMPSAEPAMPAGGWNLASDKRACASHMHPTRS
ncbi:hypothetical protein FA95DRAFT_1485872 [Auriscalpium vulgare]|uniref:Uncharacterized protein n=1 Tax=Auriscalpium vulgare TaxID=40419 RepID=A0ACB8S511_9AGAM|nr:hypothetical protein FA95DRAFT_1485872 [Auriscalpium vulgare]